MLQPIISTCLLTNTRLGMRSLRGGALRSFLSSWSHMVGHAALAYAMPDGSIPLWLARPCIALRSLRAAEYVPLSILKYMNPAICSVSDSILIFCQVENYSPSLQRLVIMGGMGTSMAPILLLLVSVLRIVVTDAHSSIATEPCAQINALQASNSSHDLPGDIALACLRSTPLDVAGNSQQLTVRPCRFRGTLERLTTASC